MRATIIGIESASRFVDGQRRIVLRFQDADCMSRDVTIPENKLPTTMLGAQLDYEVEVTLEVARQPIAQRFRPDAHAEGCVCAMCEDIRKAEDQIHTRPQ